MLEKLSANAICYQIWANTVTIFQTLLACTVSSLLSHFNSLEDRVPVDDAM